LNVYKNIRILKEEFGKKIEIHFIEKNFKHDIIQFKVNIDNIDKYIDFKYNIKSLEELLKDSI
jgi:hypothetical protein